MQVNTWNILLVLSQHGVNNALGLADFQTTWQDHLGALQCRIEGRSWVLGHTLLYQNQNLAARSSSATCQERLDKLPWSWTDGMAKSICDTSSVHWCTWRREPLGVRVGPQNLQEWKRLWLLCASDAVWDLECQCIGSQLAKLTTSQTFVSPMLNRFEHLSRVTSLPKSFVLPKSPRAGSPHLLQWA